MGLRPLGEKWKRRIARVTGLQIVHASGFGGYRFNFTTADHRHGWFDLKAYRTPGSPDGGDARQPVWGLDPPGQPCEFMSCRRLFPDSDGAR